MKPSCPLDPNMIYRASGGTEYQCADLHVRRGSDETFGRSITSAWTPDAEELRNLLNGHSVTVTVFAQHQPVMSVNTEAAQVTGDMFDKAPGQGIGAHALAAEIAKAVAKDEKDSGCDLSAGMFGPAMTALIQKIVSAYLAPTKVIPDLFVYPPLQGVIGWAQGWAGPNGEYTYTFDVAQDAARDRLPVDGWRKDGDVFPVKDAR